MKRGKVGRNERTSKRVASIAGRILSAVEGKSVLVGQFWCWKKVGNTYKLLNLGTIEELQAIAASALTQTRDRKPAPKKPKRKP